MLHDAVAAQARWTGKACSWQRGSESSLGWTCKSQHSRAVQSRGILGMFPSAVEPRIPGLGQFECMHGIACEAMLVSAGRRVS